MDDVIYEEFKGTGNQEITLIVALLRNAYSCNEYQEIWYTPEERLMSEENLRKVWILRKLLHPMDELAAMEFLLDQMKETKTNDDFFDQMKRKAST